MGCGWALSAFRGHIRTLCGLGSRGFAEMEACLLGLFFFLYCQILSLSLLPCFPEPVFLGHHEVVNLIPGVLFYIPHQVEYGVDAFHSMNLTNCLLARSN